MSTKTIFALFAIALGVFVVYSGFQNWRNDETRHYVLREAEVVDQRISIDWQRWKDLERESMEVETRVQLLDATHARHAPLVLREYFSHGEKAWEFVHAESPGSMIKCLVSEDMKTAVRNGANLPGAMAVLIIGGFIVLAGIGLHVPVSLSIMTQRRMGLVVLPLFPAAGILVACFLWPEAIARTGAAKWAPVTYQKLGERSVSAGKTSETQVALRSSIGGKTFETVLAGDSFVDTIQGTAKAGECRVNPARPWQVTLRWGWRPGLFAMILFPVPFLSVGLLFLGAFFSPYLRHQFGVQRSSSATVRQGPREEAFGMGFALLFMGSLVGTFVSLCVELWVHDDGMKWPLTIFLIPFVSMVLYFLNLFWKSVWKALQV
jgi:hypothetical protein